MPTLDFQSPPETTMSSGSESPAKSSTALVTRSVSSKGGNDMKPPRGGSFLSLSFFLGFSGGFGLPPSGSV